MDREGGDRPGGNLELSWPSPVQFQEEVIRQAGDPKLSHLKLETRDPRRAIRAGIGACSSPLAIPSPCCPEQSSRSSPAKVLATADAQGSPQLRYRKEITMVASPIYLQFVVLRGTTKDARLPARSATSVLSDSNGIGIRFNFCEA